MTIVFRLMILAVVLALASCLASKPLPDSISKAIDECVIIEENEIESFKAYPEDLAKNSQYTMEIRRMAGKQRTSDAGFRLARLVQSKGIANFDVRRLLVESAEEHGLQNWMFAVLQIYHEIDVEAIMVAARKGGVEASPFVSMR
jgi:hypothetical protein